MRISDWSSDVCSSDLLPAPLLPGAPPMTMQTRTLALAGAILLLSACGNGEEAGPGGAAGQMPPPQVGVVVAKQTTVPLTQEMVGRLAPYRSADVRARVPGVLQKRVYDEGSDVSEGDVLFLIDPAPLRAALGQAQASLAQARASYANAKRSEEHTSELQSLMRNSYAVFCLKKK